jgi:exopolysaccharide biosynthesis polyprenyl glycosylphosphotransferase
MAIPQKTRDVLLGRGVGRHSGSKHREQFATLVLAAGIGPILVTWWLTSNHLLILGLSIAALLISRLNAFPATQSHTVIVVGQSSVAKLLTAMLSEKSAGPWTSRLRSKTPTFHRVATVGEVAEAIDTTEGRFVVVAEPRDVGRVSAIADGARTPVRVLDGIRLLERSLGRVPLELVSEDGWHGGRANDRRESIYQAVKRAMDLALGVIIGLIIFPLIPFIALAIRLDSRGPVFYRQQRIGLNDRAFCIYKFRTMRADAEREGAVWASVNDSRVTRAGRIMRRARLDELPQIWNVLRGDMSFVGPRPERPEFTQVLEREIPGYRYRNLVRPGLTGWAQVRFRYTSSLHDSRVKLEYDLYYLKNASLWLDIHILIRTVGVVLGMKGC